MAPNDEPSLRSATEEHALQAPPGHRLLSRRASLLTLGLAGAAAIAACSPDSDSSSAGSSSSSSSSTSSSSSAAPSSTAASGSGTAACVTTPSETGGPFPADGSNQNGAGAVANVLDDAGVIRADLRSDIGGSDTQDGVPMSLKVQVVDASSCDPLAGAAVYVWHCNREGEYSAYSSSMIGGDFSTHSWLRGVQVTDDDGWVEFTTILPGRYQGRAFHIHFEVYQDDSYARKLLTSQMAMDDDLANQLYDEAGYSDALRNETTNGRDNVFSDGVSSQLLTMGGDVTSGLTAEIQVGV
jgi:protocatechuate 3,4-dioxygenase beta subunit